MKLLLKLLITTIFICASVLMAQAATPNSQEPSEFTPSQTKAIGQIVHDYLLANPNVIVEVVKELQEQQQTGMIKQAEKAIRDNAVQLFASPTSPVAGNPKGDVTLVEFFDYQCPHCKEMTTTVGDLIKANPHLRVVYKEFPIFPGSDFLAKAALAANAQGKYSEFHAALMNQGNPITKDVVMKVAKQVGLDTDKLQATTESAWVQKEIKNNIHLAETIGLVGTPAYVISSNKLPTPDMKIFFVPGVAKEKVLQDLISKAARQ